MTSDTTTALIAALSALGGAGLAALASLKNAARNIQVEHVTKERAKWRDSVRSLALAVHKAAVTRDQTTLSELHLQFSIILNPFDPEDRRILDVIARLPSASPDHLLQEFADRLALLLKHDWERVKREATGTWAEDLAYDQAAPVRRETYEQLLRECSRSRSRSRLN